MNTSRSIPEIMIGALMLAGLGGCADRPPTFDAEAFRSNELPGWCGWELLSIFCVEPRASMWPAVQAALEPGMERPAVLALLGDPDREVDGDLYYDMGGIGIDTDYLVVRFEDGSLVETLFQRD